jgi:hypothetical protein
VFNPWSKHPARKRRRSAVIAAIAIVMGMLGATAAISPAYADEPGLWCTIVSRGTITAPSPVPFGSQVNVQWSAQLDYCPAPVLWIDGPGFSGENLTASGSRQVRANPDGTTMTWTMYVMDLETDSHPVLQLATKTIVVP